MKDLYFTTDLTVEVRIHDKTDNGEIKMITAVRKGLIYLFFLGGVTWASDLNAQTLQSNLYGTDGQVLATVLSGDTLYIGGSFNYVGPNTGAGGALDVTTGMPDLAFPQVVNGYPQSTYAQILAVASDGSGGYYIGGAFTFVGSTARNYIAHIRSDKTLDPSWNPSANSSVWALAVSGSTVYAGGEFTSIGGQTRNYIAALDATTGNATSWNPNASSNVLALTVSGSTVYAGGYFTSIGGQTRDYIAALDATTNTNNATSWDPNASSQIYALAVSGSTVYAGGGFGSIGGQTRVNIAAINTSTGIVTSWNPSSQLGGMVFTLAVSGSTVYAGGNFNSIGGQSRNCIAALDATTGNATSWNPNANNAVNALIVS